MTSFIILRILVLDLCSCPWESIEGIQKTARLKKYGITFDNFFRNLKNLASFLYHIFIDIFEEKGLKLRDIKFDFSPSFKILPIKKGHFEVFGT
jgi:hypothetical protein